MIMMKNNCTYHGVRDISLERSVTLESEQIVNLSCFNRSKMSDWSGSGRVNMVNMVNM